MNADEALRIGRDWQRETDERLSEVNTALAALPVLAAEVERLRAMESRVRSVARDAHSGVLRWATGLILGEDA